MGNHGAGGCIYFEDVIGKFFNCPNLFPFFFNAFLRNFQEAHIISNNMCIFPPFWSLCGLKSMLSRYQTK